MSQSLKPQHAARALFSLGRGRMRRDEAGGRELPPLEVFLRQWQVERLSRTHADLLNSPEYGPATRYFLNDIYAPKDFSRRDADLLALYDFFRRFVPPPALRVLEHTVELNDLTTALEHQLIDNMRQHLGVTDHFTVEQYFTAYRMADYAERLKQIDLIVAVGQELTKLARLPFVGFTLHAAHGPAHSLGWGELQDFLERGYDAWRTMKDPEYFLHKIETREKRALNRIFGREPGDPYTSLD